MMITRNTKTILEEDEEAAVAAKKKKKKKNTTAYLSFHKLIQFSTLKSLFRYTFVSKMHNTIHDPPSPRLSDDIVFFHMLNQLHSKSLFRFSCLSKLWYNTIHHDPIFIASHYNHSKSNPSLVRISTTISETNFKYLDQGDLGDDQGASSSSSTLMLNFHTNGKYVVGSINGLTCFRTNYFIEICNPSTHEILGIPFPPKREGIDLCSYGFGFDTLMNQYKVLRVTDSVCQICTLGAGMNMSNSTPQDCIWKDITVTSHLPLRKWEMNIGVSPFISAGGALFWFISSTNIIIMFDIHYEKFQVIPGLQVCRKSLRLYSICEFRGIPYAVYRANLVDGYEFNLYALNKKKSGSYSNVGSIHFVFEQTTRFPFKTIKNHLTVSFTEFQGIYYCNGSILLLTKDIFMCPIHTRREVAKGGIEIVT